MGIIATVPSEGNPRVGPLALRATATMGHVTTITMNIVMSINIFIITTDMIIMTMVYLVLLS